MAPTYCVTPFIVYSQSIYTGIKRKYNKYSYKEVECTIVNRYIYPTVEGRIGMAPTYCVIPYKVYSQRD